MPVNSADRAKTIRMVWGSSFVLMLALIASTFWLGDLNGVHMLIAGIIMVFAVTATIAISESKVRPASEDEAETLKKLKNDDRMNEILSRMSDDDLLHLRHSLMEHDEAVRRKRG